jgi:hypothetical protein
VDQDGAMTPDEIGFNIETALDAANVQGLMVATCQLTTIHVKSGPNSTGPATDFPTSFTGSSSGVSGHAGVATLLSKITDLGGRTGRGRFFWPGLSESVVDAGGALTGAFRIAAQAIADDIISELTAAGVPMVLLHSGEVTPTPVTTLTVSTRAATQRRRQRR